VGGLRPPLTRRFQGDIIWGDDMEGLAPTVCS